MSYFAFMGIKTQGVVSIVCVTYFNSFSYEKLRFFSFSQKLHRGNGESERGKRRIFTSIL